MAGARFYDGLHPTAHEVALRASSAEVVAMLADGRIVARWPVPEIEVVSDPWQEPHALMVCPRQPGARLAVEDPGYREALAVLGANMSRAAPRRTRVTPVLGALVAALVVTIGAMALLIEKAPDAVAPYVPHAMERRIGAAVVTAMQGDSQTCEKADGVAALQRLVDRFQVASGYQQKVSVRIIDMYETTLVGGRERKRRVVNAFAAPGGHMVVMSGLLERADGPEELAGVMAHEMGHIVHRHSVKALLRAYGFGLVTKLVVGGFSSDVSSVADAGGLLLALRHSREAEREADRTALQLLDKTGMRADGLARFFGKILDEQKGKDSAQQMGVFSTHPPTNERIEMTTRPATGAPAMSAREWQALRTVCD
jgi:predicted Zn-dependent protease